jgi:PKD repeat protein
MSNGPKPLAVSFDASGSSDPDGTITDYEWDFDGNNVYNEAGPEAAARGTATPAAYTYTAVGSYTARVRVTDNDSNKDVATLPITVTNTPPTAMLTANVTDGDAPLAVSFDASGSTDPGGSITDYEWDLDGDDVYNETGAEATARHNATPAAYTYTNPQQATAHVRVTDDDGTTAVANLTVTAHGWVLVESGAVTDPGYWGDITLVNGNPALAYRCGGDNTLHYAYSTTATGASAGDWTIVTVPTTGIGQPGREVSLAIIGGKPAMSYCDNAGVSNGDLIYQRATTTTGANAADWIAPVHVMDTDDAGYNSELLDVSARPAIAFDDFTDNALHYAHASTMTGASAADWTTNIAIDDPAGGSANGCSLAKVDGNPAVVYNYWDGAQSNMNYCRSTSASGDSAADWATKVTFSNITGVSPSLASVASNPAFVYQDQNSGEVDYRRASDVDGGAWGSVVTIQTGMFGQYASLGIVGGFPAATYHDFSNGKLLYTQSTQADGSSGWATHETVASGSQGRYSTLLLVDSGTLPAIYFRDDSGKAARYAVKF